jgi:hypothetical protein
VEVLREVGLDDRHVDDLFRTGTLYEDASGPTTEDSS